jgi:hypothetical protein
MPLRPETPGLWARRSRLRLLLVAALGLLATLSASTPAQASTMITRGGHDISFIVDRHHVGLLSYTDRGGVRQHVLVWGAINARPPSRTGGQVRFRLDYSGGYGSFGAGYWKHMRNACRPYRGPNLYHLVVGCTDTDGSFWAVQWWRRGLRNGGWPTHGLRARPEIHVSHWSGPLPVLRAENSWSYRRYDAMFGTFKYRGHGVYGYGHTPRGAPLDDFGRNVFIDTHDPYWGRGWFRYNSGLTHGPTGIFCFGVYALYGRSKPAKGDRYRLTVMGPGVTPVMTVLVRAPGRYNRKLDAKKAAKQVRWAGRSNACIHPN